MAVALEGRARQLFEVRNFAHVGTVRPDGSPQVVPTWVDLEGDIIRINSVEGRAWPRNLKRNPAVSISVLNSENPYEYVSVRGRVLEATHEGADDHIDLLAKKYLGQDSYPFRQPGDERVLFRIEPDHMHYSAP